DALHAQDVRDRPEAAQGLQRPLDAPIVEPAGGGDLAPQAAQDLLVEDGSWAANGAVVDDQAHGVGAYIDHPQRLEVASGPQGDGVLHHVAAVSSAGVSVLAILGVNRRGKFSFRDSPRPDKLGFVMKYSCALNGSSPAAGWMRTELPSGSRRQLC